MYSQVANFPPARIKCVNRWWCTALSALQFLRLGWFSSWEWYMAVSWAYT